MGSRRGFETAATADPGLVLTVASLFLGKIMEKQACHAAKQDSSLLSIPGHTAWTRAAALLCWDLKP